MAFERFARDARAVVAAAGEEARSGGQLTIEAEHLLLALADQPGLRDLGLDRDRLVDALEREEERSLAAVGFSAPELDLPRAPRAPRKLQLATSAKLALHRALQDASKRRDRRLEARHLLLGVLGAERGRVPRALQIADVNVELLRARL